MGISKSAHLEDANANWWDKKTPLHEAAAAGHIDIVRLLITEGHANTNIQGNMWTPLNIAAAEGHIDVVKFLITEGYADANACDDEDETPLHVAIYGGHIDIVRFLITEGHADANIQDYLWIPLHIAVAEMADNRRPC
ncbi:ankyrin repeat-containing domain protein [Endogone sp. FLAS-F59071]|nr:ankyrin repeat-containing domain protein [Endogone sp. FLAS-F59071]|eukprot:RUS15308.1 ankyrin repeat-containing domain protein [Endogone sp. FLAS-F59071]